MRTFLTMRSRLTILAIIFGLIDAFHPKMAIGHPAAGIMLIPPLAADSAGACAPRCFQMAKVTKYGKDEPKMAF